MFRLRSIPVALNREDDYDAAVESAIKILDRNALTSGQIFYMVSEGFAQNGFPVRGRPPITIPEMNILSLTLRDSIVVIANTSGKRVPNHTALQSITAASCRTPYIMQHIECPVK